ncbi:MAG TPA: ComF family protein [Sphingobacteriaceae bacterium]|nr:ComF family protein [Sphingobacteriaceae bacterium]
MNKVYSYLDDFFSLFFPALCPACQKNLFKNELVICTDCIYHLPYTNFHLEKDNRVARQLWGRIPFSVAGSFLYFHKGSRVQNLLHQFKYNNKPEIGVKLGEMYGHILHHAAAYQDVDLIIPVPLHASKLKVRGYNQSQHFAKGLSNAMGIPLFSGVLNQRLSTTTQTKKSRFSRYENMKDIFEVADPQAIAGKHVLLVDDVITTGATIEACSIKILEIPDTRISIATIAFTD